jgi:hypothetical protein
MTKMTKTTRIAALALLGGVLCSWPLWDVGERPFRFPLLPLFGEAHFAAPVPMHWQALLLCALAAALALRPRNRGLLMAVIGCTLLLCLLDLNRLQPWVWLYLLILAAALTPHSSPLTPHPSFLLAAVYFWSGFHKLTPYFAEDNFAWFCRAFAWSRPLGHYPALGYAVAVLEMSFAAGLLWEKTRHWFRYLVVGFHGVILIALSHWGLDWNPVVLPWNLAMAALAWVSFSEKRGPEVLFRATSCWPSPGWPPRSKSGGFGHTRWLGNSTPTPSPRRLFMLKNPCDSATQTAE